MAQDVLADGFVRLCIDTSLNFYDGECRTLVEGQMGVSTVGVTPDTLVRVQTSKDIDAQFGEGSVLAETLKKMFAQCGEGAEFYAIPRADPVGATAAVFTTTVTGPATSAGHLDLFSMDAEFAVDVYVAEGATAAEIAATIVAAIPSNFMYTATDNGDGTITWTAKAGVLGEVGNYLKIDYGWLGRSNYHPDGVTISTVQTTVGVGDLDPTVYVNDYATILGRCCYTVFALLSGSVAAHYAFKLYLDSLWDCDRPQCFGHGYTYMIGSLGAIKAQFLNAEVLSPIAYQGNEPSPPWFLTGCYAALTACSACISPELSIQGRTYGVLDALLIPETCTATWAFEDQEELQSYGFVVTGPLAGGSGSYTSPYVFNDITNNLYDSLGRGNATFRDANARRLAANTAVAIATELQNFSALALYTKNTTIKQGIRGTNPKLILASMRAWAKDNIGVLFSEFDNIDEDIVLKTDFELSAPCRGDPKLLYLYMVYRPPVRIGRIVTKLKPKLLDNCSRT